MSNPEPTCSSSARNEERPAYGQTDVTPFASAFETHRAPSSQSKGDPRSSVAPPQAGPLPSTARVAKDTARDAAAPSRRRTYGDCEPSSLTTSPPMDRHTDSFHLSAVRAIAVTRPRPTLSLASSASFAAAPPLPSRRASATASPPSTPHGRRSPAITIARPSPRPQLHFTTLDSYFDDVDGPRADRSLSPSIEPEPPSKQTTRAEIPPGSELSNSKRLTY